MASPVTPRSAAASPPSRIRVIQEVFSEEEEGMQEYNLDQLDQAVEDACPVVVIEPKRLGSQTRRWIEMGNCLSNMTLFTGIATVGLYTATYANVWQSVGFVRRPCILIAAVGGLCLGSHLAYRLSWSTDPCVRYQVENRPEELQQVFHEINGHRPYSDSLLVLRHGPKKYTTFFNDFLAIFAFTLFGYRIYRMMR